MKTLLTIFLLAITSFANLSTKPSTVKPNRAGKIVVYGVAYFKKCNSEVPKYYKYRIVDAKDEYTAKKELEKDLDYNYSTALRIKMGSSSYDFGPAASAMYVYDFSKTENNCSYSVLMIQFGKDTNDAYNRAVGAKNTWGGKDAQMDQIESITF